MPTHKRRATNGIESGDQEGGDIHVTRVTGAAVDHSVLDTRSWNVDGSGLNSGGQIRGNDLQVAPAAGAAGDQINVDIPLVDVARGESETADQPEIGPHAIIVSGGEIGHVEPDAQKLDADLATLNLLYRFQRRCERQRIADDGAAKAFLRTTLGWRADQTPTERKCIAAEAAAIYAGLCLGNSVKSPALDHGGLEYVLMHVVSRQPWLAGEKAATKQIAKIAATLPAADFVESVRGFGMASFGGLIGQCGDLAQYRSPAPIWYRLGLAPKDAYPLSDAGVRMYPGTRRAWSFANIGANLLRAKSPGYYERYAERKEACLALGRTKIHAHRDAMKVMEKRLVRDLWRAWRAAKVGLTSIDQMPPTETLPHPATLAMLGD